MKKILIVLIVLISTQYILVDRLFAELGSSNDVRKCVIEYRKLMEMDVDSKKLSDRMEAWEEKCSIVLRPSGQNPTLVRAEKQVALKKNK